MQVVVVYGDRSMVDLDSHLPFRGVASTMMR
jgi:hypothetical protein